MRYTPTIGNTTSYSGAATTHEPAIDDKIAPEGPCRIIKKYPNRRLYDTHGSHYITLEDVKDLVLSRENFRVVDAKTQEDITRPILLQIITEEESNGTPMFTSDLLSQMIRVYGNATQDMLGQYLTMSIGNFTKFQSRLQEQMRNFYGNKTNLTRDIWSQFFSFQMPAMHNMLGAFIEQSRQMFVQMQGQVEQQTHQFLKAMSNTTSGQIGDKDKNPRDR